MPEREIAAAVESATGKPSGRGLVSLWLLGTREPFISQFFALCEKLGLRPSEVLRDDATPREYSGDQQILTPKKAQASFRKNVKKLHRKKPPM